MARLCERCGNMRPYHAFEKRNTHYSGFHGKVCWDCYLTEKYTREADKRREKHYVNLEQAHMRKRYAESLSGKEAHKQANMRYLATEKGKAAKAAANARYRAKQAPVAPKPRVAADPIPEWLQIDPMERQKQANKRYLATERGKATKAEANRRYRAKKALPEWLR